MKKVAAILLIMAAIIAGLWYYNERIYVLLGGSKPKEQETQQMTLEEKVGQMLMPDLRMWEGTNTTEMNPGTARLIQDYHVGGVILFGKNIVDQEQLIRLTTALQEEARDIPLLLVIDQEAPKQTRWS